MVDLKKRNADRLKKVTEEKVKRERLADYHSRKGVARDVQNYRQGSHFGNEHIKDYQERFPSSYDSSGHLAAYTAQLAISDKEAKNKNYGEALDHLGIVADNLSQDTELGKIGLTKAMEYAKAIQRRAYRISNKLADNPALDREAVHLVEVMKNYGADPHSALEKAAEALASVIGIVGGAFFLSTNVTGNAIANMTNSTTSIIGAVFLIVGLVGAFFWSRERK